MWLIRNSNFWLFSPIFRILVKLTASYTFQAKSHSWLNYAVKCLEWLLQGGAQTGDPVNQLAWLATVERGSVCSLLAAAVRRVQAVQRSSGQLCDSSAQCAGVQWDTGSNVWYAITSPNSGPGGRGSLSTPGLATNNTLCCSVCNRTCVCWGYVIKWVLRVIFH